MAEITLKSKLVFLIMHNVVNLCMISFSVCAHYYDLQRGVDTCMNSYEITLAVQKFFPLAH